MGCASSRIFSAVIHPWRKAISSRQAIFNPCRFSMTSTKIDASASESCVPVSSHAKPCESVYTFNSPACRNSWLTVVISNSPRADGLIRLATSTTLFG